MRIARACSACKGSLGNHDETTQVLYKPFNMDGKRYDTFKPELLGGVRFFAVDGSCPTRL
jgi:hypothetical protein